MRCSQINYLFFMRDLQLANRRMHVRALLLNDLLILVLKEKRGSWFSYPFFVAKKPISSPLSRICFICSMKPPIFNLLLACLLCLTQQPLTAQINPDFFPRFEADANNPLIRYGDGFADASWNDPCVLKENGLYIMYLSAAVGFTGSSKVKIYRQVSSDGYSWSLSPPTPVLEPLAGTFYEGGVETPTVVYKDGKYHMYLTTYRNNGPEDFTIGHATSSDGIQWQMDTAPLLSSDGGSSWYSHIVGEPGALVYHDSVYVFFSATGIQNGQSNQQIGVFKSSDGSHFGPPTRTVSLPEAVYPSSLHYAGLSTPSALAINDSIYLFTDVAQLLHGTWTQVALHQFKTFGNTGIWHYAPQPIHTKENFSWTNGSFLSEIRSITPLMDQGGRLRIWYAGNRLADVAGKDTTYHVTADDTGMLHVDPRFWGIGTSEYPFPNTTGIHAYQTTVEGVHLQPNPATEQLNLSLPHDAFVQVTLVNMVGKEVRKLSGKMPLQLSIPVNDLAEGCYVVHALTDNGLHYQVKVFVY